MYWPDAGCGQAVALPGKLERQHVDFSNRGGAGEEVRRLFHERRGDFARKVGLTAGIVRERIEDAKRGGASWIPNQATVSGSAFTSGNALLRKAAVSASLPGLASSVTSNAVCTCVMTLSNIRERLTI